MPFVSGLNVNQFTGTFDAAGKAFVLELGCHSVRLSQGHGQSAQGLTDDVNWAFDNGVGVCLFLGYAHQSPNAIPNSSAIDDFGSAGDTARQAYANRSANYASLYSGKVQYFEVWNEWNGGLGLGGVGGNPVTYADLLRRCYIAIKTVNPSAKVAGCVTAGVHLSWTGTVLDNGGGDFMDVLSVHPYIYFAQSATPTKVPAGTNGVTAANACAEALALQRNQILTKAGRDIPIIVTEEGGTNGHFGNSESIRAQYLTEIFTRGNNGIIPSLEGIWWFDLEDDVLGTYGLLTSANVRKQAFFSFQDVANLNPPDPPPDPPPDSPFTLITFSGTRLLRNDWTGTKGTEFTVGATPITARELGYFDEGNNGNISEHQVGLWNSAGSLLGSVTIKTGTQSPLVGEFRWEPLPLDITLSPGATYRLGGTTTAGTTDLFRDVAQPGQVNDVTYSPGVSILNGVYSPNGTGFVYPTSVFGGPGRAYIGPNLRTVDEIPAEQLPDLTILEFSYANDGIFSVTVKNDGTGASPAGVVVKVNYYVNGVHRAFSDTTVGPIVAGATIVIGTSSPPFVIPEGTWDIEARIDEDNSIVESNDANNNFEFEIVIGVEDLIGWDGPFGTNTRRIWFGHPPWTIQGGA